MKIEPKVWWEKNEIFNIQQKRGWSIKQDIEMESNIWYASEIFDIRDKNLADRAKQEGKESNIWRVSKIFINIDSSLCISTFNWNLLTKQS